MRKTTATGASSATNSPINFRMPAELRSRLRRFAKRRYLGEAEALRLIVAEAERWQFKQAYATWQRYLRGEERTVPYEEIQKIFSDALAGRPTGPTK